MLDWFNLSTMLNSVIGSLIAGLLLLTTAPVWWWKWFKPGDTTKFRKGLLSFAGVLGFLILLVYLERSSIPPHHPTLSDKEAEAAFAECAMKSIEATAAIRGSGSRLAAQRRHEKACLIDKGFEWNPRGDTE